MNFREDLFKFVTEYPRSHMDENGLISNGACNGMLDAMIEVTGSIAFAFAREVGNASIRKELYRGIRSVFYAELRQVEKVVRKERGETA